MPTLEFTTRPVKAVAGSSGLVLHGKHWISVDSPSDTIYARKFPENTDILLVGPLELSISGTLDGNSVANNILAKSELAQHLVDYLKTNAADLGFSAVSELQTREDDRPKVSVISCRSSSKPDVQPRVSLSCIRLHYAWQTGSDASADSELLQSPFSTRMSLPFRSILDNVVGRFVTFQLVRRYPLIFGSWAQQLDLETPLFAKIFKSIAAIVAKSPNPKFQSKCNRILKNIRRERQNALDATTKHLSDYLGSLDESIDGGETRLSLQDAFCLSMEHIYRNGLRKPQFKGQTNIPRDTNDDDDLADDHELPLSRQPSQQEGIDGPSMNSVSRPSSLGSAEGEHDLTMAIDYFDKIIRAHEQKQEVLSPSNAVDFDTDAGTDDLANDSNFDNASSGDDFFWHVEPSLEADSRHDAYEIDDADESDSHDESKRNLIFGGVLLSPSLPPIIDEDTDPEDRDFYLLDVDDDHPHILRTPSPLSHIPRHIDLSDAEDVVHMEIEGAESDQDGLPCGHDVDRDSPSSIDPHAPNLTLENSQFHRDQPEEEAKLTSPASFVPLMTLDEDGDEYLELVPDLEEVAGVCEEDIHLDGSADPGRPGGTELVLGSPPSFTSTGDIDILSCEFDSEDVDTDMDDPDSSSDHLPSPSPEPFSQGDILGDAEWGAEKDCTGRFGLEDFDMLLIIDD